MRIRRTAEERKSEIVETTLRLADKVGPDRLSTDDIARGVGISQAAIFRHFPSKIDLWTAVATRIGEKFQQRWFAIEQAGAKPIVQLRELLLGQLKLIQLTPAIPAILLSRELHVENKILRTIFWQFMQQLLGRVERLIVAGQREGIYRNDVEAKDAAFLMIGLIQGLVLRWSLSGRAFDLPAEGSRLLDIQLELFAGQSQQHRAAKSSQSEKHL